MDSLWWGGVSRKVLAENITLLGLLNREPEKPMENPLPPHLLTETESTSRQLSIERERDLVDSLAFLSAWSDDPEKVMAVCVEENQDSEGLTIRMASNRGNLEPVKKGFTIIASILERAAAKGKSDKDKNSSALVEEMIALNRGRIYSRLRSKHAKRSRRNHNKPPIVAQLAEAVSALNTLRLVPTVDLDSVNSQVQELQRLFRQLEALTEDQARSQRSHKTLLNLLRCAHSLSSQNDLGKLFNTIPNSGRFGPAKKSSLPIAVGKIGRYYSVCDFLIVAARRLSIFRSIRVESVKLPLPVSPPFCNIESGSTLSGALDRILEPQREKCTQGWANLITSAEAQFSEQLAAPLNTYKVHAEIQLLFYYEMYPEIRRPRVICSSKSACFLCDLFIKVHAKFYMARSHGVLYDTWLLPDRGTIRLLEKGTNDMTRVVERFNAILENRIRSTLPMDRMPRFHPNESVLIVPALWTPSAKSLASSTSTQVIAATPNSAIHLKDHQGPVANVEAFRSLPTPSTSADQGAVERGWRSTDPTASGPTLENAKCSGFLTSASSVEIPAIAPEGLLGPRARQDGATNSDIGRASTTSQHFLDRLNSPSLKSPRPVPRHKPMPKLPVRDKTQLDFSNHLNPRSSASIRESGIVASKYEPLIQGTWVERELPTGGPPVKLSTRFIHVTLSYDWAEVTNKLNIAKGQQKSQEGLRSEGDYLVKVKWLGPDEEPKRSSEAKTNIVDLDDMDEDCEEMLSHGAATSSTELYICRQVDMIAIKFLPKE